MITEDGLFIPFIEICLDRSEARSSSAGVSGSVVCCQLLILQFQLTKPSKVN